MDDKVSYVDNPNIHTHTHTRLLELMNKFTKVRECKTNIQKSTVISQYLQRTPQNKMKKTIPFAIASKRMKYL